MSNGFYQDDDTRLWGYRGVPDRLAKYIHEKGCVPVEADVLPAHEQVVAEEVSQHEPGAKLDKGKPDASLLQQFSRALLEVARVGTYGAEKYSRGGWVSVPEGRQRYTAAMLRHLLAEEVEGVFDTDDALAEYGYVEEIRHAAQVAWNALARLELQLKEEESERASD